MVKRLKEAEQVGDLLEVIRKYNVSEQSNRWRQKCGGMETSVVCRLKILERENAELKKMVVEQELDICMLKDIKAKKWETWRG